MPDAGDGQYGFCGSLPGGVIRDFPGEQNVALVYRGRHAGLRRKSGFADGVADAQGQRAVVNLSAGAARVCCRTGGNRGYEDSGGGAT